MKKKYCIPTIQLYSLSPCETMIGISGTTSPEETDAKTYSFDYKKLSQLDEKEKQSVWD